MPVCLPVQAITFEPPHTETSFLVWRYILTLSRSSLSFKAIESRSRSCTKKLLFTYFNLLFLCMWLQVINKVKVTHQGKGQIKVSFKERCPYVGGLHLNQVCSCCIYIRFHKGIVL